jgi:hypothetical protein
MQPTAILYAVIAFLGSSLVLMAMWAYFAAKVIAAGN